MSGDDPHAEKIQDCIGLVYASAMVMWLTTVLITILYARNYYGIGIGIFFAVPLFLLFFNRSYLTVNVEETMTKSGALSIVLLIGISLLNYMSGNSDDQKHTIGVLIFVSFLLFLASVPDFFFGSDYMSVTLHIHMASQIVSAGILALAVLVYFSGKFKALPKTKFSVMPGTVAATATLQVDTNNEE